MGGLKKRPEKDWKQKLFPGTPPVSKEVVRRIKATRGEDKPNPLLVMNGGLRHGDHLFVDWIVGADKEKYEGCRVAAYRGGALLKWASAGWLRDPAGRCLYAPYLRSRSGVNNFVVMLATACGHTLVPKDEGATHQRYVLETTLAGENRRLIPGDEIQFGSDKVLRVDRRQGTIDMNLYRPSAEAGSRIMSAPVDYVYMAHHPSVVARLLAEVNALYVKPVGVDTFETIFPS